MPLGGAVDPLVGAVDPHAGAVDPLLVSEHTGNRQGFVRAEHFRGWEQGRLRIGGGVCALSHDVQGGKLKSPSHVTLKNNKCVFNHEF